MTKKRISLVLVLIAIIAAISGSTWAGDIRYIYSMTGGSTAYFQDAEPGSTIWVYELQATKGQKKAGRPIGYFRKGKEGDNTYIYRSDGSQPLYFVEQEPGNNTYVYSMTDGGAWGYFSK